MFILDDVCRGTKKLIVIDVGVMTSMVGLSSGKGRPISVSTYTMRLGRETRIERGGWRGTKRSRMVRRVSRSK